MLDMEEWLMIRELHAQGHNISEIARMTGHSRNTVRKYLNSADPPRYPGRDPRPSILNPFKERIRSLLDAHEGLSVVRLFEEIQKEGYSGSYTLVKNYVRTFREKLGVPAVYRFETKPGHQMQVDWSEIGYMDIDGKVRKCYCFNAILGWSRTKYIDFTLATDTATLLQCLLDAFDFFGGYTKEFLFDNTKSVILKRAMKYSDNTWNPQFEEFFKHFEFIPRLCRPYTPQTKGKIENTVKYVRHNYIAGRVFNDFWNLRNGRWAWLEMADSKPHGTTHEVPLERMKAERNHLRPLHVASRPEYVVYRVAKRKVTRDCYLSYESNLYSVPYRFAGREATIKARAGRLQVHIDGEQVCEHELLTGSHRVSRNKEHFKGLLKEIHDHRKGDHGQQGKLRRLDLPGGGDVYVEKRDLAVYDRFAASTGGGDGRG